MTISLNFPDKGTVLCFSNEIKQYIIKFTSLKSSKSFLSKLKENMDKQHLDFEIEDDMIINLDKK